MASKSAPARPASSNVFAPGERFLTVGVVASYFGVTEVTIKNWVDSGQLLAARTVGGHRRIAASSVVVLLEKQGRAVPSELARRKPLVVLLANDVASSRNLRRTLSTKTRVEHIQDGYVALLAIARMRPELVVADLRTTGLDAKKFLLALQSDPATANTSIVTLGSMEPKLTERGDSARSASLIHHVRPGETKEVADAVLHRLERAPVSRVRRH